MTNKSSAVASSGGVGGKRKRGVDEEQEDEEFDGSATGQGHAKSKGVSMGMSAVEGVSVKVEKGLGMEGEYGAPRRVGEVQGDGDMFEEAGGVVDAGLVEGKTFLQYQ